jgi:hypothetical protein
MAENPEARPEKVAALPVSDLPHAPFSFYEAAPALGSRIALSISPCRHKIHGPQRTFGRHGDLLTNPQKKPPSAATATATITIFAYTSLDDDHWGRGQVRPG